MALIKYPDVLKKAQNELDTVCGADRSPIIDDFSRLPYMMACMSEVIGVMFLSLVAAESSQVLRWRPVAAGGIPHVLTQDDTYEGYVLPKGTMLFASAWAIHRNEEEYEKPDDFIPERFLDNKFGTLSKINTQDDHRRVTYGFGAGRRVCPGQHLAENSLVRLSCM